VHGDFRNGNLLVDEDGLVAVLDWELAHLGDPLQDLGYLCANVWRFGSPLPVGGFGDYADLFAGYASVTGETPPMRDIHYWQVHAALSWGMVCLLMLHMYRSGQDPSLERAAIGRRLSEAEIDLLLLLEEVPA
jgi:aminoglycoside phosphotransferase (APT) family kinase protein